MFGGCGGAPDAANLLPVREGRKPVCGSHKWDKIGDGPSYEMVTYSMKYSLTEGNEASGIAAGQLSVNARYRWHSEYCQLCLYIIRCVRTYA